MIPSVGAGERPSSRTTLRGTGHSGALVAEVLAVGGSAAILLYALRGPLFQGRTTFIHDVLYWTYPVFHFLAANILQGRIPYWNPFSHAGEPLYPLFLQLHMLDPVNLVALGIGRFFTVNLTTLFNWSRVACGLTASLGAYIFLRQWTPYLLVRISLLPILLWSSFLLTSFRQTGTNDMFIFGPYAAYFVFRILHFDDRRWLNWIGLGIAVGLAWQSYYFVGVWVFILFTLVGFAAFCPGALRRLGRTPRLVPRVAVTATLVSLMALPNAVVLLEHRAYLFPPRLVDRASGAPSPAGGPLQAEPGASAEEDKSVVMPYALVRRTGSFIRVWDFFLLTVPDANRPASTGALKTSTFGRPSELFMYLGLLVYCGALLGLIAGRHEHKRVWVLNLVGFGLLVLGPDGGLHWMLYHVYPPLWFLRHTELLLNFFLLAVLYFYVLGANRLLECRRGPLFDDERAHWGSRAPQGASRISWYFAFARFVLFGYVLGMLTLGLSVTPLLGNYWPTAAMGLFLESALAFTLWPRLGSQGLFWGLLATHSLIVLKIDPAPAVFLARIAMFLALPLGVLALVRRWEPRALRVAFGLLILTVVADLGQYLSASSVFWSERRPELVSTASPGPPPPRFINSRATALSPTVRYAQSIRYVELASEIPTAFSSVRLRPGADSPGELPLSTVLDAPRWNSLLMLRDYFALIHADLSPSVLEELLAIRRPLIQFRTRASVMAPEDFRSTLRRVGDAAAVAELRTTVILHDAVPGSTAAAPPSPADGDSRFRFRLTHYDYNTLELAVEAASPGFLAYADGWAPQWRASVDGRPAPVLRANGNFKAVPIEAGTHAVRLEFDPAAFRWSLYAFFGTPIIAVAILLAMTIGRSLLRQPAGRPDVALRDPAASLP